MTSTASGLTSPMCHQAATPSRWL
ncbi:hypothetical protein EK904_011610 [Melospiza melodia maxima]|nr:hypothetical protein EK904_011610 [Melospiza melodia maxima]